MKDRFIFLRVHISQQIINLLFELTQHSLLPGYLLL